MKVQLLEHLLGRKSMENGLSKSGGVTSLVPLSSTTGQLLATCAKCNQAVTFASPEDKDYVLCFNPTCKLFMLPQKAVWITADLVVPSMPPEDGWWETQHEGRIKYSQMTQDHLLASLQMVYRNQGWRRWSIAKLIAWSKYRGVQFDNYRKLINESRSLKDEVRLSLEKL